MPRSVRTGTPQPTWKQGFARSASESAHPELWKGLVGAWSPGLGPTGSILHDAAAFKNDGTWNGTGEHWATSDGRYTGQFNGSDDFVDADGPQKTLAGATLATLSFWGHRSATNRRVTCGFQNSPFRFNIIWFSDGKAYHQVEDGTGNFPNYALTGTGWHHFLMTFDGSLPQSDRMKVYLDGQNKTLSGTIQPPAALASAANLESFKIGIDNDTTRFTTGLIDDTLLYTRVLNPSETSKLNKLGRGGIFQRKPMTLVKAPGGILRQITTAYHRINA